MKKTSILFGLMILFITSCKSDVEKKNEQLIAKSDSIYTDCTNVIIERFSWINIDSIQTAYSNIKTPKEKLVFAEKLQLFTTNKVKAVDSIIHAKQEEEAKLNAINEAKEKINWDNSKAGKIQKKHPNWSKEECRNIAENKIWIGMTIEMLKAERGLPNNANPSNYGNGTEWQWCWDDYTPSCFYGKNDGIITSYN